MHIADKVISIYNILKSYKENGSLDVVKEKTQTVTKYLKMLQSLC